MLTVVANRLEQIDEVRIVQRIERPPPLAPHLHELHRPEHPQLLGDQVPESPVASASCSTERSVSRRA